MHAQQLKSTGSSIPIVTTPWGKWSTNASDMLLSFIMGLSCVLVYWEDIQASHVAISLQFSGIEWSTVSILLRLIKGGIIHWTCHPVALILGSLCRQNPRKPRMSMRL